MEFLQTSALWQLLLIVQLITGSCFIKEHFPVKWNNVIETPMHINVCWFHYVEILKKKGIFPYNIKVNPHSGIFSHTFSTFDFLEKKMWIFLKSGFCPMLNLIQGHAMNLYLITKKRDVCILFVSKHLEYSSSFLQVL